MDLQINNKVYIVTGGAKGIGGAISRAIAAEGGIPIIVDLDGEAAQALAEELGQAHAIAKKLGSPDSCASVVEESLKLYGRIDGLVNNVGVNDGVGLENGSPERWHASLEKSLHHVYYLAHYALPALKETKGSIVNISSKTAVTGQGGTSGYIAAKGAILALTREWAVELRKYGIRSNAVVPAEVMTPMYEEWVSAFEDPVAKLKEIADKIPFGQRLTRPEEIADMAVFLLSARASHITGQHLFVDGGYVHLDRSINSVEERQ